MPDIGPDEPPRESSISPQRLPYGLGSVRKARLDTEALTMQGELQAGSLMRRHYVLSLGTNAALPSLHQSASCFNTDRTCLQGRHAWTQKRSRGQASSHAESMTAWHTLRSLYIGSCTATRGYSAA